MNKPESRKENFEIDSYCVDYRNKEDISSFSSSSKAVKSNDSLSAPKNNEKSTEDLFLDDFKDNSQNQDEVPKKDDLNDYPYENKEDNAPTKYKHIINKKPKAFRAVIFSLAAIAMVAVFVGLFDKTSLFKNTGDVNYDMFILPLVMQDPQPFDAVNNLDSQVALEASIWSTILSKPMDYYNNFDQNGRTVIPFSDIDNSSKELFGPGYQLKIDDINGGSFFEIDPNNKDFHISPKGNGDCFIPNTESQEIGSDEINLTVAYLEPADPYGGSEDDQTPSKKMRYTLKKDVSTKKYYISSVSNL